uniref:Uncharacterized protein n=1 Tax=Rhizophora mucronata TaxID=61149 RepID=A0A2P2P654_RHIMU
MVDHHKDYLDLDYRKEPSPFHNHPLAHQSCHYTSHLHTIHQNLVSIQPTTVRPSKSAI